MQVKIAKDYAEMSRLAADMVAQLLENKPDAVLGLATGSTPIGLYEELVRRHKAGLDFSRVTTFNLDEYYGLDRDHPASYNYFMWEHLFSKINISKDRINIPNGAAPDPEEECRRYEAKIAAAGGIDLQVLGIGHNAHIGFNEPGTPFGSTTSLVQLTPSTIKANARFFEKEEDVPRQAISMGIKSIMQSRSIILLANGEGKAEAVAAAIEGPVTEKVPASVLQLHPNCTFILDEAAASKLTR
ncbi:MAG TPA: glucosamine-6-phosphate deaminase [Firmicutes bacterium]|nr:glucosamine-6-phosphate deaminase [Bacillota bacterium]